MSAPKSTATDPTEPLLFVAMPYGKRHDPTGRHQVDFDALFNDCILLAARDAKVQAIRADQETLGGFAIKPMFERLLLSEIVIADLTFSNPNVAFGERFQNTPIAVRTAVFSVTKNVFASARRALMRSAIST